MLKTYLFYGSYNVLCFFRLLESSQNENIELEDAPWGITMEDVFETYGVNKDTVENLIENKNDSYFALENGQEMFGEKTSQIYFSFVDASFSGKPQQLYEIRVVCIRMMQIWNRY